MKYDNSSVRRQDRLLCEERALQLIESAEYGVLSMVSEDGSPYAVPVNFVYDGEKSFYVHCAPEGRKLRAIAHCDMVQLCVVGRVNLLPDKFTTEYESIIISGRASTGLAEAERRHALQLLIAKLSPDYKDVGMKYAEKSFHRTEIIRIDAESVSGKCKYVPVIK